MEELAAEEHVLLEKMHKLKERKQGKEYINLRNIRKPQDIAELNSLKREVAYERNTQLLQELDITIGKLHTMRLCPMNEKLIELREKYLGSKN